MAAFDSFVNAVPMTVVFVDCSLARSYSSNEQMIEFLIAAAVSTAPMDRSEQINRFCAYVVGIPYASDNFTDEEWERFKYCRENLQ